MPSKNILEHKSLICELAIFKGQMCSVHTVTHTCIFKDFHTAKNILHIEKSTLHETYLSFEIVHNILLCIGVLIFKM